jgi:multiple antibiotic resistance protein
MDHPTVHFTTIFMALFAIMNPITNTPIFIGITDGMDAAMRRSVALRGGLLAFAIVAVFAIGGREIFAAFGITLPAFRIAGGILVGLVGYHLLQGENSSVHTPTEEDNTNSIDSAIGIATSPLALPLLAGPGTIATAMNFSAGASDSEILRVLVALAAVCLLNFLAFNSANTLVRFLGQNVIKVVSRLMGLILAVIGVQMLIEGIRGAIAA